jgi:hypothetical protein
MNQPAKMYVHLRTTLQGDQVAYEQISLLVRWYWNVLSVIRKFLF